MNRIEKLFLGLILVAALVIPASASWNITDFENFNETLGIDNTLWMNRVDNFTEHPGVGVMFSQPVEQVYDRPWMPVWLFFSFFFGGVGAILGSSYRRKTDTEMWFALIAVAFLTICYVTQPFIVEQGIVSHRIEYGVYDGQKESPQFLIWVQPYTYAIAVPYLPYICQLFWVLGMLNLFLAGYNFIRYGLLKPKPIMEGDNRNV